MASSVLQQELERLLMHRMALEAAIKELEHEGRRTRDGLERAGGRSRLLDAKAGQLAKNIRQNEAELADISQKIERIQQQMACADPM